MFSETVWDFCFPTRCASCETLLGPSASPHICARCASAITLIAPPICPRCGAPESGSAKNPTECRRCRFRTPHFDCARSVFQYQANLEDVDPLAIILKHYKYGRRQALAKDLAGLLPQPLPLAADGVEMVVPVPLHRWRLWWRSFNQAALLAAEIARRLDLPLEVQALIRIRRTPPQTRQSAAGRRRNVSGAFAVQHPARIRGRRILLVDDVMTTGATSDECARTLKEAGAKCVYVLTLARAV